MQSVAMRSTRRTAVVGPDGRGGGPAESFKRTARIAGLFFIGTFVFSMPANLLYGLVLKAQYVVGPRADHRVFPGAFLETLLAVSNIGTAIVLFPIVQRRSGKLGLGLHHGAISLLSVVTLRHAFATTAGADAASFVTVSKSLVASMTSPPQRPHHEVDGDSRVPEIAWGSVRRHLPDVQGIRAVAHPRRDRPSQWGTAAL